MAAAVVPPGYTVNKYDCAVPGQLAEITRLTALADVQQGTKKLFNSRVLPWTLGCAPSNKWALHVRHYVAKTPEELIVGWLVAETRRRFSRTYVYLSEISVTRVPNPQHAGIGRTLHAALLADARADGAAFIYLYPLTPEAAASYTKWGYQTPKEMNPRNNLYPEIKHQFLPLDGQAIPNKLLSKLNPEPPARVFIEAGAIAGPDAELRKVIDRASRMRKDDPAFVAKIRDVLETIAVFGVSGDEGEDALSREEQLKMLRDVFGSAGGRRTRKQKRRARPTRGLGSRPTRRR